MKNKIVLVLAITLLLLMGCAKTAQNTQEINSPLTSLPNTTMLQTNAPVKGDTIATITTSEGVMKAKLFEKEVPETVKNFKLLADKYAGVPFHRVIPNFMIQTGDFESQNGMGGYSYKGVGTTIPDEFNSDLRNIYGALSMANRGANTNGSQFFIVQAKATPWLDGKHTVFGQVYEGLDVLEKIANTDTDTSDRPLEPITIESVTISTL